MGIDLAALRQRLTLYAAGAGVSAILGILALIYLADAIHAAWRALLTPALASLVTAGCLLVLIGLVLGLAVLIARRRARRRPPAPPPRDLLAEAASLTKRHPLASVAAAFTAGFAASRSSAAEAALVAALHQAAEQMTQPQQRNGG